ncbi:copper chaperone NosL [Neorhizobium galegae]|uniref:nitrous oxide reductase accessory protein NosL n=1 Tax=Neorhizobium galegae TaxID=399 RepID=UPI001ECD0A35|nr:nitrous oxide reductase accessory protein NosL [Neorhizobium galegae]MBP2562378.1 copper chaperone NosL [Neorhizobium galegae]MDQ0138154.1 copper chaperone NosL [Neorhizobium galegae]
MINRMCPALFLAMLALLTACKQEVSQNITPQDLTPETLGHYCQMNLMEHPGPKAQVFLKDNPAPLFFSQIRDAIAYTRAPEQVAPIVAFYINDMGAATATWDEPGDGNWITADNAFYVIGSGRQGGMGAPETVPFSSRARAEEFARAEGGQVLRLAEITDDLVLAPVESDTNQESTNADLQDRLRALNNKTGG